MSKNQPWCENQMWSENEKSFICLGHLNEARVFNCLYKKPSKGKRPGGKYKCMDYEPTDKSEVIE